MCSKPGWVGLKRHPHQVPATVDDRIRRGDESPPGIQIVGRPKIPEGQEGFPVVGITMGGFRIGTFLGTPDQVDEYIGLAGLSGEGVTVLILCQSKGRIAHSPRDGF